MEGRLGRGRPNKSVDGWSKLTLEQGVHKTFFTSKSLEIPENLIKSYKTLENDLRNHELSLKKISYLNFLLFNTYFFELRKNQVFSHSTEG